MADSRFEQGWSARRQNDSSKNVINCHARGAFEVQMGKVKSSMQIAYKSETSGP
jgi:hypothetical protein